MMSCSRSKGQGVVGLSLFDKKIWKEYIDPIIKKWILSPFSNFVTKTFLYIGAGVVAAPMLEHLLLKVILLEYLGIDLPIDVPDVPAYITGVVLMTLGALYNLAIVYLGNINNRHTQEEKKEKQKRENPHDQEIIEEIISFLPYENTRYWVETARISGMRRDFAHDLDECEKYSTPPYNLYNQTIENKKQELMEQIKAFNSACLDYLGAQEDKTGKMYLPPYHWKSYGGESAARYYELSHKVAEAGQAFLDKYDEFITGVKSEGFILGKI